jgi:hypothetical protein
MNSKKAKKLKRIARAIARGNPQLQERIYKRLKTIRTDGTNKK